MDTGSQSDPAGFETLRAFSRTTAINRWLYEKISGFTRGRILEVGSGIGNISSFLLKNHSDVSLSDLRPEYCQILEKIFFRDPHLRGVYELDLSLPDFNMKYASLLEGFDTVIALNVIEHIADDSNAILNAKSLLRKNGKLVILVPAGQWLYNPIDSELGHYKRYTKDELSDLLKSAGLADTSNRYFNATAILGWWFSGKILREKTLSSSKLNLYDKLVPLFRIVDWFVSPFTGISVISVGTKI